MSAAFPRLAACLLLLCCIGMGTACTGEPAPPATRSLPAEPAAPVAPRAVEPRIALVIGNGRYESSPLANPVRDAELVATTLTELGFEVRLHTDGDQKAMKRAIQEFGAALERGGADSVGLFFYAGHGVQRDGRNYLIPVGAEIARDADVEIEAVSADWVLEQMRHARNRLNFVILDACRNDPFARGLRSAGRGLAKMDAPAGVLIAYSTAPGDVAADGDDGNSPYTAALSRAMRESGEPAELMFKQVRNDVRRATAERQTPWESSSLTGQNFYFATRPGSAPTPAPPTTAPLAIPPPSPATNPAAASGTAGRTEAASPSPPPSAATTTAAGTSAADTAEEPYFMEDPLCRVVVGRWRVEGEGVRGFVTFDPRATGVAKLRQPDQSGALGWDCDPGRGELVVTYRGGVTHRLRAAGDEKLMFGYDQDQQATVYTR